MNFIITGGAGFIGSHLAEYLVSKKHHVTVIDNFHVGRHDNLINIKNDIEIIKLDILNYEKLKKVVTNTDGIFHHAALTSVQDSLIQKDEYYKVNVMGTENILKLASQFGFKVIFASTASVYGNPKKIPIMENVTKKPLNPYGATKLRGEKLSIKYAKKGVSVIALRYFNVYGLRQNRNYAGVITKFLDKIKDKKPPIIFGDGYQIRDFVYVGDIVRANLSAMTSNLKTGFINIGSGKPTSVSNLAILMINLSGYEMNPVYRKSRSGEINESLADISLASKLLDWKPKTHLKNWLKKIMI